MDRACWKHTQRTQFQQCPAEACKHGTSSVPWVALYSDEVTTRAQPQLSRHRKGCQRRAWMTTGLLQQAEQLCKHLEGHSTSSTWGLLLVAGVTTSLPKLSLPSRCAPCLSSSCAFSARRRCTSALRAAFSPAAAWLTTACSRQAWASLHSRQAAVAVCLELANPCTDDAAQPNAQACRCDHTCWHNVSVCADCYSLLCCSKQWALQA